MGWFIAYRLIQAHRARGGELMAEKYSNMTAFAQPSSEQSSSHDSLNEYPRTVAVVVTYNREDAAEDSRWYRFW